MPVAKSDRAIIAATGDADRTAFLLAAVQAIRKRVVGTDVIKLRRGLIVPRAPTLPAIDCDDRTLITAEQDDVWIVGVDPSVLIIIAAGCAAPAFPCFAPVQRFPTNCAGLINDRRAFRIKLYDRQVTAADAGARPRIISPHDPRSAAVFRSKNIRSDQCFDGREQGPG